MVKERLIEFIKYKGLSLSKFEKYVGLSNGYVYNISKGIGSDKLQRILAKFPELRFDLNNGITLCECCHSKTDNYKGRANKVIVY